MNSSRQQSAGTTTSFDQLVLERSHEVPVLVDFWAEWCGPCHALDPVLAAAVDARAEPVELVKVNVDDDRATAAKYSIQGIPAVKLFRDGEPVAEFIGAQGRAAVDAFLERNLGPSKQERLIADLRRRAASPDLIESLELGYHDQALARMLELVRQAPDIAARDEARSLMVAVFEALGQDHPLSQRYRRQLASTLY